MDSKWRYQWWCKFKYSSVNKKLIEALKITHNNKHLCVDEDVSNHMQHYYNRHVQYDFFTQNKSNYLIV